MEQSSEYQALLSKFAACGGTDVSYFEHHYPRFEATLNRVLPHPPSD